MFKNDLKNQQWHEVIQQADFNTAWDQIKAIVKNVIDRHAPFIERTVRGRDCLWLTRDLKQIIHKRDYQLGRAKQTNKSEDWSNYCRLRNRTTYAMRKAKANLERSIFLENDLNPKDFWRQVRKCYPAREEKSTSKIFNIANKPVSKKQKIANAFCRYFTSVTSLIASSASNITNSTLSDLSDKVNPNNRHFYFNVVNY